MTRPPPEWPSELPPDGPSTTAACRASGLTRHQLRTVGLVPMHRGLWVPASVAGELAVRAASALAVLPPGSAISHGTSVRLLGLPTPLRPSSYFDDARADEGEDEDLTVHVTVTRRPVPRIAGLTIHHSATVLPVRTSPGGLLVTSAARTWLDLAATLSREDLVALGDKALHRRQASIAELKEFVDAGGARRGIALARSALPLLDGRSRSPMESRLRLLLGDAGLTGFEVNEPIRDEHHEILLTPDIGYFAELHAIEFLGDQHRTDRLQWREDNARVEILRDFGWTWTLLTAPDVLRRPAVTTDRIRRVLGR